MYNKEVLLVFHYRQGGWHGTEVLRYEDEMKAKNDLQLATCYGIESNELSDEEADTILHKEFPRNMDNTEGKKRFAFQGKRESFQAEIVPYNDVAEWQYIKDVSIIHKDGKSYNFSDEYFTDYEKAKDRFRKMAEADIEKQDRDTARLQRITLDIYMNMGKYKWAEIDKDQNVTTFGLKTYKIKDLRRDKTQYQDGPNASVLLRMIDAYQRGEHLFMTPSERRWALPEEIPLRKKRDLQKQKEKILDTDNAVVWVIKRESIIGNKYFKTNTRFESKEDAVSYMKTKLKSDMKLYSCKYPEEVMSRFEESISEGKKPRYHMSGHIKIQGTDVPVTVDGELELERLKRKAKVNTLYEMEQTTVTKERKMTL